MCTPPTHNPSSSSDNGDMHSFQIIENSVEIEDLIGSKRSRVHTEFSTFSMSLSPQHALFRANKGADIILVPSAFTVSTGQAHWITLLKARAIENQSYVIAAAQYGKHNTKRESYGHSVIIDPWGSIGKKIWFDKSKDTIKNYNIYFTILYCVVVGQCRPNIPLSSGDENLKTNLPAQQENNPINNPFLNFSNDMNEDGEVCYGLYDPSHLLSIRQRMPLKDHKRFRVLPLN
jgi:hypothetical protein